MLRDGESNPGLPRDRRGYSPLYYRGVDHSSKILTIYWVIYVIILRKNVVIFEIFEVKYQF